MKRHIKYNNAVSFKLAWAGESTKRGKSLRLYEIQIIRNISFVQSRVANI